MIYDDDLPIKLGFSIAGWMRADGPQVDQSPGASRSRCYGPI